MCKSYQFFMLLSSVFFSAQKQSSTYLEYPYRYLDKNFKIKITNNDYQETIVKYRFYKDRVIGKTYQDSLGVVLAKEFDGDWQKINSAAFQRGYTWRRLGYHLWETPERSREIASRYNIKMPYSFRIFISDEHNHDAYLQKFFKNLKDKLFAATKNSSAYNMSAEQFLNYALLHNPLLLSDYKESLQTK